MSQYLTALAAVLRDANLVVVEMAGWPTRGRSNNSMYADGRPWCVMVHHTASAGDGHDDAEYCTFGHPDAPICNLVIGRDGIVYVCAAGPTNTNGKGNPMTFSKGTVPADSMNTYAVGIELSSNGVGQTYPQVQVDACIAACNAITAAYGMNPDDIGTHNVYAPDRKIDPATAAAVLGPWRPASSTSSGTWDLTDIRDECRRRAGTLPPPTIGKVVDMYVIAVSRNGWPGPVDLVVSAEATRWNQNGNTSSLDKLAGVPRLEVDKDQALGVLIDRPGDGPCPFEILPDYFDAELAAAW